MKKISVLFLILVFTVTSFSQKVERGIIYWNEQQHLLIDDFTIVADSSSKIKGNNLAITRTGITYSITSKPQTKTFDIKIYATMHKTNSFIRASVLDAPASSINYLLNHEQKHFDISEIYAREAVKLLITKRFSKNHVKEIGALMQGLFKQSEAMQDLYDKETSNGSNAAIQKEWDSRIQIHLNSLENYKRKVLIRNLLIL